MIYKSLAESLIKYAIVIWGGILNNALHALNISHKYLIKTMLKLNRTHSTDTLYTKEISDIRTMYIINVSAYIKYKLKPSVINHIYSTRRKLNKNLDIPKSTNEINARFINTLGIKIYNLLPTAIIQLIRPNIFIKECSTYVFSNKQAFLKLFQKL